MLVDTHCHINMMVKKKFDALLTQEQLVNAQIILDDAAQSQVTHIINVGTSLIESINCVELAKMFSSIHAAVGIHPNDATEQWFSDFKEIKKLAKQKEQNKIVAIGECGFDKHYPGYNLTRQRDAFRAQIELALEHDLALIVHTRDAAEETIMFLEEFKQEPLRGVIHCFSEDQAFADAAINLGFVLGIGGPLTYPANDRLREIFTNVPLEKIILETDAPFLPPQHMRGKQNHPKYIATVAQYLAELRNQSFDDIARQTTENVERVFNLSLL